MTTTPSTLTVSPSPSAVAAGSAAPPVRQTMVAVATIVGSVLSAGVVLWHPWPPRDDFAYASFVPVRDAAWLGGVLDFVGHSAAAVGLALAVSLLVRGRGARLATIGAPLTALGGVLFGAGSLVWMTLAWYGSSSALDEAAGTALFDYVADHLDHLLIPQAIGLACFTLGTLLLAVALWRSGSVPRWVAGILGAFTVLQFAVPTAAMDVVQAARLGTFVVVAWFLLRPRPVAA